jgi:hypothetical protein
MPLRPAFQPDSCARAKPKKNKSLCPALPRTRIQKPKTRKPLAGQRALFLELLKKLVKP